jgi:glutathione S-transferase/maleylpyruvate isomerase
MLTIYSVPVASYCAKLRIVLRNKNIIFNELPPPGGYGSNEYRKIVPSGNLPAMIHDDFMLSDSESIAEYLDEFFPSVAMMPNTIKLRAKAREFSRSHDTRLEPAVRKLYPEVEFSTRNIESVELTGFEISKQLAALALLLSKNPLDTDKLWICDCGFAVTFAWIKAFENSLGLIVDWPDEVKQYDLRLLGFKVVSDELSAYLPAMNKYLEKALPV